jgi:hypothetical protein
MGEKDTRIDEDEAKLCTSCMYALSPLVFPAELSAPTHATQDRSGGIII